MTPHRLRDRPRGVIGTVVTPANLARFDHPNSEALGLIEANIFTVNKPCGMEFN